MTDMQECGIPHTVGALEIGNGNSIILTQPIECVARLDDVGDPGARRAARHRGLGWHRGDVDDGTGKQAGGQQAVGLCKLGAVDPVA